MTTSLPLTAVAAWLAIAAVWAQSGSPWIVPRTLDGHPDFSGVWTHYDPTPFERLEPHERPKPGMAVSTASWLGHDHPVSAARASLVIDPSDGRVPLRPEAEAIRDHHLVGIFDGPEHHSPWERCITRGVPGAMFPGGYNMGLEIIQTADYVVIHHEMVHVARVIPLDGRPHSDPRIRFWDGEPRGRWEGETLVVDSRNFNGKGWVASHAGAGRIKGIPQSEQFHLVERFRRVGPDRIDYEATIEDPMMFTRSWTVALPLNRDPAHGLFEYACHEANYAMGNILSGARSLERQR